MSTRSMISVYDGEYYKTVYCHFDGYPSNQLPLLGGYTFGECNELVDRGGMSYLGHCVKTTAYFDSDGVPDLWDSREELLREVLGRIDIEYLYINEGDGWEVIDRDEVSESALQT